MYITAQRAFSISPDRHYRLLHAAAEEKLKMTVLSVIVQEAEGLEAKDANGMTTKTFTFQRPLIKCFIAKKSCLHPKYFCDFLLQEAR